MNANIKIYIGLLVLSFSCTNAMAQREESYKEPGGRNNWYVELGGRALLYSLNFEKYLYRSDSRKMTWTAAVGLGYCPLQYRLLNTVYLDAGSVVAPFSSSLWLGRGKEKLEIGAGFTLLSKSYTKADEVLPTFILGFRVIDVNGTCFRVAYTPHLRNDDLVNWFGVIIGRNFNFKGD